MNVLVGQELCYFSGLINPYSLLHCWHLASSFSYAFHCYPSGLCRLVFSNASQKAGEQSCQMNSQTLCFAGRRGLCPQGEGKDIKDNFTPIFALALKFLVHMEGKGRLVFAISSRMPSKEFTSQCLIGLNQESLARAISGVWTLLLPFFFLTPSEACAPMDSLLLRKWSLKQEKFCSLPGLTNSYRDDIFDIIAS